MTEESTGPVRALPTSRLRFRPAARAAVTGGFWADRRATNRDVTLPMAWERLHEAGNFTNLEVAAGLSAPEAYVEAVPFFDTDVYKWLEAVGWTLADPLLDPAAAARLREQLASTVALLDAAQADDGYLHSTFQVRFPGQRFEQLRWGHELYCAGHLIQAAVAVRRAGGGDGLLAVANRWADLVAGSFGDGPGQVGGIDGHPEIESALVELYRETGEVRHLDTARLLVDRRGHGWLGADQLGLAYWQDRVPVREATVVEGHAVRQLYLLAAVADLHAETGEVALLEAAERLWEELVATKTYLTGGVGTHHRDEAVGDAYELTNERSYAETCAAIASVMFSWRMLLATGEARYADLMERTLFNGFLAGVSMDGRRHVYANPLQVREGHVHAGNQHDYRRQDWFSCACCPPNVMRTLASLEHYVVIGGADELRVHQYVTGRFTAQLDGGEATVEVETDYPWDGRVAVRVVESPAGPWSLTFRVPHWADHVDLEVDGSSVAGAPQGGWVTVTREWAVGDQVVLTLPLEPRLTVADPRVDADRGLVALERGPLVYCVEAVDAPGVRLDDLLLDLEVPPTVGPGAPDLAGATTLLVQAHAAARTPGSWWPYADAGAGTAPERGEPLTLTAVPYHLWGNRGEGAMRVWLRTS